MARLREKRDYLLRKENEEYENKKNLISKCLNDNKKIPYELRDTAKDVLEEIIFTSPIETMECISLFVTTSRDPSSSLMRFAKHISLTFPTATLLKRGNMNIEELDRIGKENNCAIMVLTENKGIPSGMIVCYFSLGVIYKYSIHNFLLKDVKNIGKNVFLICEGEDKIWEKAKETWKILFPQCNKSNRFLCLFWKDNMLMFREYFTNKVIEDGCKFNAKLYEIRKGTFNCEGEKEWVYKPYMNSNK
ncbi:hypothetical protein CWI38_0419p0010 [Hamiltosporidium tvaerminnensis]|uniref:U3 small nucleolar ribonucleoprotein protein IMP4 n=2 Tax=Hamiltosporidium TaxID=1176354 RepID=A0A4Q9LIT5_9MICR|nr:snoRNA-binding rRNA-processing protein imp4 [Hamiltosporidium tvaerminnensis]TBU03568.1 hypothetical protein CWI36_0903p0010 [Hamiltosporidium magnivora]TBU04021.1 hypothetical protein CWI37_0195p0020 [Hamiltosporidium tvaerminnensis]TBU08093.1 hypothetical protein CWI39_0227p0020 [Hamiltosporidium magnivora]TBU13479.1 hypothetical protein CWI38_0419p0010 [Hamiltosporidium tvaerminnensis]